MGEAQASREVYLNRPALTVGRFRSIPSELNRRRSGLGLSASTTLLSSRGFPDAREETPPLCISMVQSSSLQCRHVSQANEFKALRQMDSLCRMKREEDPRASWTGSCSGA